MKKIIVSFVTVASVLLSLFDSIKINAEEESVFSSPAISNNMSTINEISDSLSILQLDGKESSNYGNNYFLYSSVINSYINENDDKTLTRLEYINNEIIVENFNKKGIAISADTIALELDIFGGAFFGENYNFLVFGQENPSESDDIEVVRIVRYSKEWVRIDSLSVYGANTYIPFDAGSLRMTETNDKLYIHTCHKMYASSIDGKNHQANMTFVVNQEDMTITDSYTGISNISAGYVSHSFNQFVQTDGNYVYRVDHGDAYPRGISLTRCSVNGNITNISYIKPASFAGEIGNNYTGANVGGFELGNSNCLIAYSSIDQENEFSTQYNIKIAIADKSFSNSETINITNYAETDYIDIGCPQLIKFSDNEFLLMWYEYDNSEATKAIIKYVTLNECGELTSDIVSNTTTAISQCQPVYCSDGLIRWYVTNDSAPVLYAINPLALDELNNEPITTTPAVTTTVTAESITTSTTVTTSAVNDDQTGVYESLRYIKTDENNDGIFDYVTITGGTRSFEYIISVNIPEEIEGLPVTAISDSAFFYCMRLKYLTLPDSLTYIGASSFSYCPLEELTIPDSVNYIGSMAFEGCASRIENITIPNNVEAISSRLFYDCNNLKSVIIGSSVTEIHYNAFAKCTSLKSIIIPQNVSSFIGKGAFEGCLSLTDIIIENPYCEVYDDASTIADTATIYGYENSTAQAYAEKYGRNFISLGEAPVITTPAITTISTTQTSATTMQTTVTADITDIEDNETGDANLDGKLNVRDAAFIASALAKGLTNTLPENADYNGDGKVNVRDAAAIASYLAKRL